jgi:hypothetical protein
MSPEVLEPPKSPSPKVLEPPKSPSPKACVILRASNDVSIASKLVHTRRDHETTRPIAPTLSLSLFSVSCSFECADCCSQTPDPFQLSSQPLG